MKTLAEIYLPVEKVMIDNLFDQILNIIKEKKKIPYLDADNNPKDEYLEYFVINEVMITFNKRGGNKTKDKITIKELKNAIKIAFRSDLEFTRVGFNKMNGKSNTSGMPLYLLMNLIADEIKKHKIVGQEISHQTFGRGIISRIENEKDSISFKYGEEIKLLSMDYFSLDKEDEEKINNLLTAEDNPII